MVVSFWFLGSESHYARCLLMRFWRVEYTTSYAFAAPLALVKWPCLRASIARAIRPSCCIDWVVFGRGILAKVCGYAWERVQSDQLAYMTSSLIKYVNVLYKRVSHICECPTLYAFRRVLLYFSQNASTQHHPINATRRLNYSCSRCS